MESRNSFSLYSSSSFSGIFGMFIILVIYWYDYIMKFTHLHAHSHYSLLDGLPKIADLVAAAKTAGMTARALTDHGSLYGAMEFYKQAKKTGIKPIIGLEAYLAPRSLSDKSGPADSDYFHMILLARDLAGYKNLMELVTISHIDGYYYKPRIDKETLRRHSTGLIGLSGCLRGEVSRALAAQNFSQAQKAALEYRDIFGQDSFYLEVQRNNAGDIQNQVNDGLVKLSRETGIPLAATNDCLYLDASDNAAQDILVCVGTGTTVEATDRLDMRGMDLHLASPEEMEKRFADLPEALANTQKIADGVNLELQLEQRHFPVFAVPDGYSAETFLDKLCYEGLIKRYGTPRGELPEEVLKRIEYELDVINKKGFSAYFLVVS